MRKDLEDLHRVGAVSVSNLGCFGDFSDDQLEPKPNFYKV